MSGSSGMSRSWVGSAGAGGRRHEGPDVPAPGRQPRLQTPAPGPARERPDRVARPGRADCTVQPAVLVPLDQLPVAVADGAARAASLVAVVRVVPEERSAVEAAVLRAAARGSRRRVLLGIERQARQLEQRRIEVRADDRRVADAAGLRHAGRAMIQGSRMPPS